MRRCAQSFTRSRNAASVADMSSPPYPQPWSARWQQRLMTLWTRSNVTANGGQVPLAVIAVTLASIVLLFINAALLVINTAGTMDSNAQYARSYEIKRSLTEFQSIVSAAESAQRGYLLTGQLAYLEPFFRATRSWRETLERLSKLAS